MLTETVLPHESRTATVRKKRHRSSLIDLNKQRSLNNGGDDLDAISRLAPTNLASKPRKVYFAVLFTVAGHGVGVCVFATANGTPRSR